MQADPGGQIPIWTWAKNSIEVNVDSKLWSKTIDSGTGTSNW
jgi:hypothetical protein